MSVQIGQLAITANTKAIFPAPSDGQKAILIGNESGLTCTVTMEGGGVQKTLYPSTLDWFPVRSGFTGNILISPTAILNNTSSWPSSTLVFDAIGLNDHETGAQYPLQLNRNTNVGNTVSTAMGSSTSWQNDNNAASTQVGEAQQTGSSGSNVFLDNSGNFYLAQWVSATYTKIFQVIANGASVIKLGATGLLTEVLGSLTVDQNATITGTSTFTGDATFNGAGNGVTVTNNALISGNETVSGILTVTGDATFNGAGNSITVTNNSLISGNEAVSGTLTVTGDASLNGAGTGLAVANNQTIGGTLGVTGAVTATSTSNSVVASSLRGTTNLPLGKLGVAADGDVIDASSPTAIYLKCRNSAGSINFQMPDGNTIAFIDSTGITASNGVNYNVGRIKDINTGTTSATGVINHGLSGTPSAVLCTTDSASSTQTEGADTYTSTQFSHRSGSALTTRWVAYR